MPTAIILCTASSSRHKKSIAHQNLVRRLKKGSLCGLCAPDLEHDQRMRVSQWNAEQTNLTRQEREVPATTSRFPGAPVTAVAAPRDLRSAVSKTDTKELVCVDSRLPQGSTGQIQRMCCCNCIPCSHVRATSTGLTCVD